MRECTLGNSNDDIRQDGKTSSRLFGEFYVAVYPVTQYPPFQTIHLDSQNLRPGQIIDKFRCFTDVVDINILVIVLRPEIDSFISRIRTSGNSVDFPEKSEWTVEVDWIDKCHGWPRTLNLSRISVRKLYHLHL